MSNGTRTPDHMQEAASIFSASGLSVIPIGNLETKAPGLDTWKPYTRQAACPQDAAHWFVSNGRPAAPGLGIVCGAVSGGLTVIDFDTKDDGLTLYDEWTALVEELCPGLVATLPLVATPSGGRHVYLRCDVVEGNTKLAESSTHQTWIETRGEGGYVVAPPTTGYRVLAGRISAVPTISMAERELLLSAARSLTMKPPAPARLPDGCNPLPGAAYNAKADVLSICGLLTGSGWTLVHGSTDAATLRRPGKDRGISATVRLCNGTPVTYAFSTNAAPLPAGVGLSPFAVYTLLEHGGDYRAAARALGGAPRVAVTPTAIVTTSGEPDGEKDYRKRVFSAHDLWHQVFKPLDWVVEGVIPPGLTLLAGSPKAGKSLMGLNIACAVATGGVALGSVKVRRRHVLYLLLEDGKRLAQKRLHRQLAEAPESEYLLMAQDWPRLGEGGITDIADYIEDYPDCLIVADTYESLRSVTRVGEDSYRNDYGALKPLADLCHEKDVSVVIVHHTNKRNPVDPFQSVNGSNGITGVCDTVGVLNRGEEPDTAVLHLRGRDLDSDMRLALDFDPLTGCHRLIGDELSVGKNGAQRDIVAFLRGYGRDASKPEIARGTDRENDKALWRQIERMVDAGTLVRTEWGRYALPPDATVRTFATGPFPTQNGDSNSPEPVENGPVANVANAQTEAAPVHSTLDDGRFMGIAKDLQLAPCTGCGKRWSKVFHPSGDGSMWCKNCGVAVAGA